MMYIKTMPVGEFDVVLSGEDDVAVKSIMTILDNTRTLHYNWNLLDAIHEVMRKLNVKMVIVDKSTPNEANDVSR